MIRTDDRRDEARAGARPDDVINVKNKPCISGKPQEFYGFDDECILFTTNTNSRLMYGRPLALGRGSVDNGPSDAWAGMFQSGTYYRIDGVTGLTKEEVKLANGCEPYGLVVDSQQIGWSPNLWSEPLCWFNTKAVNGVHEVGKAKANPSGLQGYGVGLDWFL